MTGSLSRGFVALALLGAVSSAGCSKHTSDVVQSTTSTPNALVRFEARLVDGQNGAPVANATITFCGFGATTSDKNGFVQFDLVGITSATNGVSGRVDASGYASEQFQQSFTVNDTTTGNNNTSDIQLADQGIISLNHARTLNVVVTKNGTPVSGATVVAALSNNTSTNSNRQAFASASNSGACQVVLTALTNGSGIATIAGIDGGNSSSNGSSSVTSAEYHVFVPAENLSGGPGFDWATTSFFDNNTNNGNYAYSVVGGTISIALQPSVSPEGVVRVVSDSSTPFNGVASMSQGAIADVAINNGTNTNYGSSTVGSGVRSGIDITTTPSNSVFSTDGSVTLIFETPVAVINEPSKQFQTEFGFQNMLVTPVSTTAIAADTIITGTATVVSGSLNTMWKFTPPSNIPLNANYGISFYATTNVTDFTNGSLPSDSQIVLVNWGGTNGAGLSRAPSNSTIADPTADNYNGTLTDTVNAATHTAQVYLEFSEVVAGSIAVVGYTHPDGTVVNQSDSSFTIGNIRPSLVFNAAVAPGQTNAQLGASSGVKFRVPLELNNNSSNRLALEDQSTVTVAINVRNAAGKTLQKTLTLTVK